MWISTEYKYEVKEWNSINHKYRIYITVGIEYLIPVYIDIVA